MVHHLWRRGIVVALLTHVHSKGACDVSAKELEVWVDEADEDLELGIGMLSYRC